ncbi:MAG: HEAT repeat domain-containing protein [Planctomycetes bacterium]|nr:HEAT repeat domain-containing protein [Planctomycetota bacterium]
MARLALCLLAAWGISGCEREAPPAAPANPLKDVPTAELLERLRESTGPTDVADELVRRGAKALPYLMAALRGEDERLAMDCGFIVIGIGNAAAPAVQELLRSGTPRQRARALQVIRYGAMAARVAREAEAIGRRSTPGKDMTAFLDLRADVIAALRDPSDGVRTDAANALRQFGPCDDATASALILALRGDASASVRSHSAFALGHGAEGRADVEEALAEALAKDADARVREAAADALGAMAGVSNATLDALRHAEEMDPVPKVKESAALSLALQRQKAALR